MFIPVKPPVGGVEAEAVEAERDDDPVGGHDGEPGQQPGVRQQRAHTCQTGLIKTSDVE